MDSRQSYSSAPIPSPRSELNLPSTDMRKGESMDSDTNTNTTTTDSDEVEQQG